ncbi:MAG: hypothetical protein M3R25_04395 [Bacteroidota bacterium]|nr:hypothetical protein [Bacteroidota bacterium]
MKYFFTLLVLCTLAVSAQSQIWFEAGVKGAYGPTVLLDKNVFDSGNYKHKISTGHAIGGRLGVNFGYHAGFAVEYLAANSKQEFNLDGRLHTTYKWKHSDLLVLFRYAGNGAYVEVGGKYSNLGDVTRETKPADPDVDGDVSDIFEKNYTSGVLGFGSYLLGNDLLAVNLGIRIHYAFTDIITPAGKDNFYPAASDINNPDPDAKTLAAAAQLQLEVNYAFGRFSKTACHDRWKLILFQ